MHVKKINVLLAKKYLIRDCAPKHNVRLSMTKWTLKADCYSTAVGYCRWLIIFVYYGVNTRNLAVVQGVPKKRTPLVHFDDNFGKYGPILTFFSLLQQKLYDAQKLSYFSHLTFIMLLHYLAKQTWCWYQCKFFWIMQQYKLVCIPVPEIFIYYYRFVPGKGLLPDIQARCRQHRWTFQ